jgi:hypothetical protein
MTSALGEKVAEITPNALAVNIVGSVAAVLSAVVAVGAVSSLPHRVSARGFEGVLIVAGVFVVLGLHELVHALSLMAYAKLPWRVFKFGFNWRQCLLYCHCREPVSMPAFRVFGFAPLVVIGSSTLLLTLLYPALWLAVVTALHLAGCVGDVWILLRLRRFPDDYLVLDFTDRIGCAVFRPAPPFPGSLNAANSRQ